MARLNESSASAESVEILKRRFVRQNREIARVNSIQSLRIRSLESEVSHLLTENVSLREQVITLTQELERFEAAKALHDGVYNVKARLDSKLLELSNLVAELSSLPRQFAKACREKAESAPQGQPRQSCSGVKNTFADFDPNSGIESDGRLPVILEGKYYPRRTLEPLELQQLTNDADISSSPELNETLSSPDQSPEDDDSSTPTAEIPVDMKTLGHYAQDDNILPPNLETRRKKRMSPAKADVEQGDIEHISLLDSKFAQKCGAKRKFSEDEESFESVPAEDDGFEFSRPTHSPLKFSSFVEHSPAKRKSQSTVGAISNGQPKRKVLEPKSTNVNIPSPSIPTLKSYDEPDNSKRIGVNENSYPTQPKEVNKDVSPKNARASLTKTSRSSLHDSGHDDQAAADTSNVPTRPSRRHRAVISYAEPNLRDKMRRSTNELVPAVGIGKPRKSSSQTTQADATQESGEEKSSFASGRKARTSETANGEHDSEITGNHSKRQLNMVSQRKRKPSPTGRIIRVDDDTMWRGAIAEDQPPCSGFDGHVSDEEPKNGDTIIARPTKGTADDGAQTVVSNAPDIHTSIERAASDTRMQSRRHSSNTKALEKGITPSFSTGTSDIGSGFNEVSTHPTRSKEYPKGDLQDDGDTSFWMDARQMTRGQRAAARRRSMML